MAGCKPEVPAQSPRPTPQGTNASPAPASQLEPRFDSRALGAQPLAPYSGSEALRALYRNAGIDLPALSVLCRRFGRELPGFRVDPSDAVRLWTLLNAQAQTTGYTPLLVKDDHGTFWDWPDDEYRSHTQAELDAAATLDVDAWIQKRKAEALADGGQIPRSPGATASPGSALAVLADYKGRPSKLLFIMLVPTRDSTEIPAILMYGGWNACPHPSEHVAMLRRWRDRYGAQLIALTGDTLECVVARPAGQLEATPLAEEMYWYSPDIVDQGTESVDALASSLAGSKYWFFWWD